MTTLVRIAVMLAAIAVMGCKGAQPTSAGSGTSAGDGGSGAASSSGSGLLAAITGGGIKVSWVTDPSLNNMNAFSVTVPAGWQVQGTIHKSGCTAIPGSVFRATSPDGKSRSELMPLFGWQWGTGPLALKDSNCLPLEGGMSADDFLKYLAGVMKVHYDGPQAVPAEVIAKHQADVDRLSGRFPAVQSHKYQFGFAGVSFQEGSVQMKGRLRVMLDCSQNSLPPQKRLIYPPGGGQPHWTQTDPTTLNNCVATTTYISAPANQLASVINQWESEKCGVQVEEPWLQADSRRQQQYADARLQNAMNASNAQMQAQNQRFQHDQMVNRQMHQEFMDTMQRGTDMSMARTQESMNARGTATSDWVDYSLNRQTVMDTRTGETYKMPNQVTVQNPLTKVHGDGTPIQ